MGPVLKVLSSDKVLALDGLQTFKIKVFKSPLDVSIDLSATRNDHKGVVGGGLEPSNTVAVRSIEFVDKSIASFESFAEVLSCKAD